MGWFCICPGPGGWVHSCWLLAGYLYFVWAVVVESDGVSLTLAWCGKTRHGGGSSSRAPFQVPPAPRKQGQSDRQSAGLGNPSSVNLQMDLCHTPSPPHIRSVHTKVPPEGDKHANPRPETAIFTECKPCQTQLASLARRSDTSLPKYGV